MGDLGMLVSGRQRPPTWQIGGPRNACATAYERKSLPDTTRKGETPPEGEGTGARKSNGLRRLPFDPGRRGLLPPGLRGARLRPGIVGGDEVIDPDAHLVVGPVAPVDGARGGAGVGRVVGRVVEVRQHLEPGPLG